MTRSTPAGARRDILAAAGQRFGARGYGGTSLQDIATDVGYSKSAVLYHFTSKGQMMRDLLTPSISALTELNASLGGLDPDTAQDRAIIGFVEVTVQFRHECKLIPGALRDLADIPELADLHLAKVGMGIISAMAGHPEDPVAMISALTLVLGIPSALADAGDLPDEFLRQALVEMARRAVDVPLVDRTG